MRAGQVHVSFLSTQSIFIRFHMKESLTFPEHKKSENEDWKSDKYWKIFLDMVCALMKF